MADSTIDSELLILRNNWGMAPNQALNAPHDGFSTSTVLNTSTALYPVGTVVQVYNKGDTGKQGYAQFIYLQVGTQNSASAIAVKSVVIPDSATVWYQITNDPDDCVKIPTGQAAIALGAVTNAYYAFFWCGGICPEEHISGLGGTYATEGNLLAGPFTAHDLAADKVGLGPSDDANGVIGEDIFGFALAADT